MRRSHIRGDEYRDEGISFSHLTPDCYTIDFVIRTGTVVGKGLAFSSSQVGVRISNSS